MNGTVNGLIARSVFWLGLLLAAAAMPAAAEMAMTRVVAVDGDAVPLEAGTAACLELMNEARRAAGLAPSQPAHSR